MVRRPIRYLCSFQSSDQVHTEGIISSSTDTSSLRLNCVVTSDMEEDFIESKEALLGAQRRRGHSNGFVVGLVLFSNVVTFILASQLSRWLWVSCEAPTPTLSSEYQAIKALYPSFLANHIVREPLEN